MKKYILTMLIGLSNVAVADLTPLGKITFTQGHEVASCRMVGFVSNDGTFQKTFRIPAANTDIEAIILAALMADKNVHIFYTPGQTTGCGSDDRIQWVEVQKD